MNPKTPQDLDPKLKEAYDRVMGGNFSPSTPITPNPMPKLETAAPTTASTPSHTLTPSSIPLTIPVPAAPPPPLTAMSPSSSPSSPMQQTSPTKKKMRFSPIIFLVVGLVFFVVYAVVWGKVFNLF